MQGQMSIQSKSRFHPLPLQFPCLPAAQSGSIIISGGSLIFKYSIPIDHKAYQYKYGYNVRNYKDYKWIHYLTASRISSINLFAAFSIAQFIYSLVESSSFIRTATPILKDMLYSVVSDSDSVTLVTYTPAGSFTIYHFLLVPRVWWSLSLPRQSTWSAFLVHSSSW